MTINDHEMFIGGVADGWRNSARRGVKYVVYPTIRNPRWVRDPSGRQRLSFEQDYYGRTKVIHGSVTIEFWRFLGMPLAEAKRMAIERYRESNYNA